MSFRLHPHEPVTKGIRRVLLSQIDAAEKLLGDKAHAPEAIHDARKSFKRIRATLRLVRSGIGEKAFKRETAAFREIAAQLAGARDRHVLLQTAMMIAGSEADAGSDQNESDDPSSAPLAPAVAALTKVLQTENGEAAAGTSSRARAANARHALGAARKRIRHLRIAPDDFSPVVRGVRRTQRDLVASMHAALELQTDEAFHDWRKNVQRHWRHMKLLSAAWPEYFEARAATARELSQLLGDDHDLSMLIAFVGNRDRGGLTARMAREVTAASRTRQAALRAKACTLGARLAADAPKSLARHVAALWDVAHRHPTVPAVPPSQ